MRILSNIALGKYVDTDSVVHRLDPRTKLLSALLLMTSALTLDAALPLILFTAFLVLAIRLAKIPATTLLANLKPFLWLFAFTVILHALMTPGPVLVHIPGLQWSVSQEGLRFGLLFCWRLATMVTVAALMTLTTPPLALTDGLERMLRPLRCIGFPAHEFAMMIAIALRFIPVLAEEAERIRKAQLARGADFGGGSVAAGKADGAASGAAVPVGLRPRRPPGGRHGEPLLPGGRRPHEFPRALLFQGRPDRGSRRRLGRGPHGRSPRCDRSRPRELPHHPPRPRVRRYRFPRLADPGPRPAPFRESSPGRCASSCRNR